jgi:hypothetical protein
MNGEIVIFKLVYQLALKRYAVAKNFPRVELGWFGKHGVH